MRDFNPMLYLQNSPIVLDDEKLKSKLASVKKTPYVERIKATIDAMEARAGG